MRATYLLCLIFLVNVIISCKKDPVTQTAGNDILSLVFNKGAVSTINREKREVIVDIADFIDRKQLVAIFQLSDGAVAAVNGKKQFSSETPNDFTEPVTYTVTSSAGESATWVVKLQTNNSRIGLGNVVTAEKRLVRPYEWYISQDGSGSAAKVNGAFACVAMALKWVDIYKYPDISTEDIRGNISGGVVPPEAVYNALSSRNIFFKLITLSSNNTDITEHIDKGNLVIILTDFEAIPYNELKQQYTNRFYPFLSKTIPTTGHWIVIKGYKIVDGILYYETYDPFSNGERYENGEPKGRNRYYSAGYIATGLSRANGWPYAFVIDNKQSVSTEVLRNEVYMPYFQPPLPDLKYGYIPKLGTLVSIAYGY